MTQKELAVALGFPSQSYVSEIESGKKVPIAELILRVADLFEVSIDRLMRDELEIE